MFDFIRTHTRLMLGLIVLLIIPSFVFFGIEGYSRFNDESMANAAKVGSRSISRAEWEAAHQRQVERMRQQMPDVDVKLFDTPEAKRRTLDLLVQDLVLRQAAAKMHTLPGNERLDRLFKSDPAMNGLRNPDGSVNRAIIEAQGMTSEVFAERLRQDYAMQHVADAVQNTAFVAPTALTIDLDALLQRRELQYQRFDPSTYAGSVHPTEDQLVAYHKAHAQRFMAPERATIEYVVLDLDSIGRDTALSEEELRKYYDENIARYTTAEERRASHILIKADKDLPAADRAKAKARAEAILAEVRKAPSTFAEVARKQSEDTGSAGQGGDLDYFGRGTMVKPFEDAVFAMKKGEISDVIESDFGYHIIELTDVRGGQKKPFDQVRGEIEAEVRKALAQKRYAEAAEQFSETVYQQYDSLQPVIDQLKLQKHTAVVGRTPAPGATGALASEKLLSAVFGHESLDNKRNTDAIEIGPNQMASARIVKYEPAHALTLDEVRDQVRADVVAEQAAALARKDGQARLELVRKDEAKLPESATISRTQTHDLPREVIDAALRADVAKGPAAVGVDLGERGYVVLRVLKVLPREPLPGGDAQAQQQIAQALAAAETEAYLSALKTRYKAEIIPAVVNQVARAASAP